MLQFDQLDEAVKATAFLRELCLSLHIVRLQDGEPLFSATHGEVKETAAVQKGVHDMEPGIQRGRGVSPREAQRAHDVLRVPLVITGQACALEMIQPRRCALSAFSYHAGTGFRAEDTVIGAIGKRTYQDTLTGLYNHRYVDLFLPDALRAAYEREQPLSMIAAQIDQLPLVIEHYGHLIGDLALQHVAQLLQQKVHQADCWVARYDADVFLICLPEADFTAATRVANRIRVAMIGERFPLESGALNLTCSFGVQSVCKQNGSLTARMLLDRTLEALRQAKRSEQNALK